MRYETIIAVTGFETFVQPESLWKTTRLPALSSYSVFRTIVLTLGSWA